MKISLSLDSELKEQWCGFVGPISGLSDKPRRSNELAQVK
jgi:hypothetical protein